MIPDIVGNRVYVWERGEVTTLALGGRKNKSAVSKVPKIFILTYKYFSLLTIAR